MNYVIQVYRKYAAFGGRARRREYWSFALFFLVIFFATEVLVSFGKGSHNVAIQIGGAAMLVVFAVGSLVPGLAVRIRRLHDINKSGFWILIAILPIIGELVLLVFSLLPGTRGANRYGPDPKVVGDDVARVFS